MLSEVDEPKVKSKPESRCEVGEVWKQESLQTQEYSSSRASKQLDEECRLSDWSFMLLAGVANRKF